MMQKVQISDGVASQLYELAKVEHISATELMEQLVKAYKIEIAKRNELKEFFKPYQKDMTGFKFSREEANER
ncbi:hypothetical protein [Candidatus Thiosymbion oneisti]|uniref:hypothetical protein n=1 Tax=Candidatus Thiosymbion oneisti TaxID=589554 RepID=UPI00114CEA0E|nr:hypothetical protein [Candidatus Thiosymbion oneisti]